MSNLAELGKKKSGWDLAHLAECLPSTQEPLGSIPSRAFAGYRQLHMPGVPASEDGGHPQLPSKCEASVGYMRPGFNKQSSACLGNPTSTSAFHSPLTHCEPTKTD